MTMQWQKNEKRQHTDNSIENQTGLSNTGKGIQILLRMCQNIVLSKGMFKKVCTNVAVTPLSQTYETMPSCHRTKNNKTINLSKGKLIYSKA